VPFKTHEILTDEITPREQRSLKAYQIEKLASPESANSLLDMTAAGNDSAEGVLDSFLTNPETAR